MTYSLLTKKLIEQGFCRIERDDRLLDVFPTQTREKGIELWEKTDGKQVTITRLRLPYNPQKTQIFTIPRSKLVRALNRNTTINLLEQPSSKNVTFEN